MQPTKHQLIIFSFFSFPIARNLFIFLLLFPRMQTDISFKVNIVDATIWVLLLFVRRKEFTMFRFRCIFRGFQLCFVSTFCISFTCIHFVPQRIWDENSYRRNIFEIALVSNWQSLIAKWMKKLNQSAQRGVRWPLLSFIIV